MAYRYITKAEKLGRGAKSLAASLDKRRAKLAGVEVPDTVQWAEALDYKNFDFDKFVTWLGEVGKTGGKHTGVVALWLSKYLVLVGNKIFVDNPVLRRLDKLAKNTAKSWEEAKYEETGKKKHKPSKVAKFVKEQPWTVGYLVYYAMLASIAMGWGALDNDKSQEKEEIKNESREEVNPAVVVEPIEETKPEAVVKPIEEAKPEVTPELVAESVQEIVQTSDINTIDPMSSGYVKKAINEYWPEIAVGLTELETYRAKAKRHGSEARSTNGLGITYTYYYDRAGNLYRKDNPIDAKKVKQFDTAGNYEQAKRHMIYEVLPALQRATGGKKNIEAQQAIAIVWAGHQRPADMNEIARRISNATTVQQVADAFAYYPGALKWREGTLIRRWWCAAYAVGLIDMKDFLSLRPDAFSSINVNNVYRDGHFLLGEETVKYALNRAKGSKRTVSGFMDDFDGGRKMLATVNGRVAGKKLVLLRGGSKDKIFESSMAKLNSATALFAKADYKGAVKLCEEAIKLDPDNMEAYSSLALAYKKLGDKEKSISYYEKCLATVVAGNKRMNENKSLLMDYDVKAASYFNAGMAREEMAKLYLKTKDKEKAQQNFRKALKNYQTSLENAEVDNMSERRKQVYKEAVERVEKQLKELDGQDKGKKLALSMDAGIKKIRQRNALNSSAKKSRGDALLYGNAKIVGDGNELA